MKKVNEMEKKVNEMEKGIKEKQKERKEKIKENFEILLNGILTLLWIRGILSLEEVSACQHLIKILIKRA